MFLVALGNGCFFCKSYKKQLVKMTALLVVTGYCGLLFISWYICMNSGKGNCLTNTMCKWHMVSCVCVTYVWRARVLGYVCVCHTPTSTRSDTWCYVCYLCAAGARARPACRRTARRSCRGWSAWAATAAAARRAACRARGATAGGSARTAPRPRTPRRGTARSTTCRGAPDLTQHAHAINDEHLARVQTMRVPTPTDTRIWCDKHKSTLWMESMSKYLKQIMNRSYVANRDVKDTLLKYLVYNIHNIIKIKIWNTRHKIPLI